MSIFIKISQADKLIIQRVKIIVEPTEQMCGLAAMADRSDSDKQSVSNRRPLTGLTAENFLYAGYRFSSHKEDVRDISSASADTGTDHTDCYQIPDKRSNIDRRSGGDRRCGTDSRSEAERFLEGERRSGVDRRSRRGRRYRSFKKARAFVRGLKLNSENEWHEYVKSGIKPDDIPVEPHHIYANHGWAGWGDWLGANPFDTYLSRHRFMARALVHRLGLGKSTVRPDDLPTNAEGKA